MTDPRYKKLARLLVEYSTGLKRGDRVLLDMIDVPDEFSIELVRAARAAGATPLVEVRHTRVSRELLLEMNARHAAVVRDLELFRRSSVKSVRPKEKRPNPSRPTSRTRLLSFVGLRSARRPHSAL